MVDKTIDIYLLLHSEEAVAQIMDVQKWTNMLTNSLQDMVHNTQTAGVTLTSVFKGSMATLRAELENMRAANREAAAKGTHETLPFQKEDFDAVKQAMQNLAIAHRNVQEQQKLGRSEAKEYAKSTDEIGRAAIESAKKVNELSNQIKEQYRNQAQGQKVTPQQFTDQFVEQFKATPIAGVDVEQATRAAAQAAKELTSEDRELAAAQAALNKNMKETTPAIKSVNDTMKEGGAAAGIFGSSLNGLKSVVSLVFGGSLAIIAVRALQSVIQYFKEAARAGIEYAQDLIRLRVAINILQENGLNITLKETLTLIGKLNEQFPIFTRKALVEGVSYMSLLTQNLGLTNEQMGNVNEISAALAVVMGKDFNDAAREVALFLSSGYGEALQKTGILASRASVAHELLKEGIEGGYTRATDAQRAFAAYNVLLDQSAGITSKATELQKDQAYAIQRLVKAWDDLKNSIGIGLSGSILKAADGLAWVVEQFHNYYNAIKTAEAATKAGVTTIAFAYAQLAQFVGYALKHMFDPGFDAMKEWNNFSQNIFKVSRDAFEKNMAEAFPDLFPNLKDSAEQTGKTLQEELDKLTQEAQDMAKDIIDLQKKFKDDSDKLEQDYQDDMAKIDQDGADKRLEIFNKFLDDVTEISVKADQDIADATTKYNQDVVDVNRQYNIQRAQAEQKYRDNELKAERDFQEKMRRLREDFILNLEDAVRERDAMQIIRLTRKYNLDRERLQRDNDEETRTRREAYARETKDAEAQKNERLRQLKIELDRRIAEINLNKDREIAARTAQYKQEQHDLEVSLKKQRDERKARYDEQLEDMAKAHQEQIDALVANWQEQNNLTKDQLTQIESAINKAIGSDGTTTAIWKAYFEFLRLNSAGVRDQLIADAITMQAYMANAAAGMIAPNPQSLIPPNAPQTNPNWSGAPTAANPASSHPGVPQAVIDFLHKLGVPGWAEGGTMVATKPTLAMFGERGAETATFTPASKASQMGGKVTVALDLSPDLEARITDNTLNEMAEVMLSVGGRSK